MGVPIPTKRMLGIVAPLGDEIYEVYMVVRFQPSVLAKISTIMGKGGIGMRLVHAQVPRGERLGYLSLYVEMRDAAVGIGQLINLLKAQPFVVEVKAESKKEVIYSSSMFPLVAGERYRVFALGGTSWVRLVKSIKEKFGSGGEAMLHELGVSYGEEMAVRIRKRTGKVLRQATLISDLRGLIKSYGQGILQIERRGRGFQASIAEAVSALSEGPVVDHFLVGMVRGALGTITGLSYTVGKLRIDEREKTIRFDLVPSRPRRR